MLPLATPSPRQRQRRLDSGRHLRRISTTCVVIFLLAAPTTARSEQAPCLGLGQPNEEARSQSKRKLIERVNGSTITLHARSYCGPAQYRFKTVQHHLGEVFKSAPLLEEVERQNYQTREVGEASLRDSIFKIYDTLVATLLSLASVHHEEWANAVGESLEESEGTAPPARDHFDKAVNAYETVLSVYGRLWQVMKRSQRPHASSVFSIYEQQELMLRQSQVHTLLATIFHRDGDGRATYKHLTHSQNWCERSLSLLGVDYQDNDDEGTCAEEQGAEHVAAVKNARKGMALIQVQMGSLLSGLYTVGYVLHSDGDIHLEPSHDSGESAHLREDQKAILALALNHLMQGVSHYIQLSADGSDYRSALAECCAYLGKTFGYLHEWEPAAQQLEMATSLYVDLFEENKIPKANLSTQIMKTTESLYEAYLNLHDETGNAKKAFLQHISFRRYLSQSMPLDHRLTDDKGDEDRISENLNAGNFTSENNDISTSLKTYEKMLEEYLRQQNSAYEIWFDLDTNTANHVQHNKIYEGSLRHAIGSLKLAQNHVRMAKNELELAVGCFRDGMEEGVEDTVEYSTKIELANALLNLALAELGLQHWRSSYVAFEQAVDLFALELPNGESPMKAYQISDP